MNHDAQHEPKEETKEMAFWPNSWVGYGISVLQRFASWNSKRDSIHKMWIVTNLVKLVSELVHLDAKMDKVSKLIYVIF